ncbi:MAG: mycothiol synthase [Microthrixaceae bacterium]
MRRPAPSHPSGAIALGSDSTGAWLVPVEGGWELDLGTLPSAHDEAVREGTARLHAACDAAADHGGGPLRLWVRGPDHTGAEIAEASGMSVRRELLQMRRALPVEESFDLDVRPFVVGQDESRWLEVNNRAFQWHPEQGGMTLAELRAHERAPWFDPAGFLLHEEGGVLVGFCWTKVHAELDPPLGEIFVIAVDPAAHQRGLGRRLVLAGLDHLHGQGLTIGMLYTEADNAPAVHLYRELGFSVHATDRVYARDVDAR